VHELIFGEVLFLLKKIQGTKTDFRKLPFKDKKMSP
jgi:hypothetical protein